MTAIRTIIVDDEPLARERLRTLLADTPEFEIVDECADAPAAIAAIDTQGPDLVFLDVQMPGGSGFDVLEALPADRLPRVVFVTAFDEHAVRAFEVHALDYLLKPFDRERFDDALARAREDLGRDRERADTRGLHGLLADLRGQGARLVVRTGGRILFLRTEEIDHVEAAGNYVHLHVGDASHLVRETMAALETRLDTEQFVRISRSTIVNLDRIRELRPTPQRDFSVILEDGTTLKLSRRFRDALEERLGESL